MTKISNEWRAALVTTAVVALVAPSLAHAQGSDGLCGGVAGTAVTESIGVARVAKGRGNVHFARGRDDKLKQCPSADAACRDTAYLVAGDIVLTTNSEAKSAKVGAPSGFVCATFANAKGRETSGWLPEAALEALPVTPVPSAGWLGTWMRTEASIRVKPSGSSALKIEGDATYGAHDKGRVARGAVNTGEFDGTAEPRDGVVLIAEKGVASFEAAKDTGCAVRLRRLGPYLLVEDNRNCGGMNVSFRGIYVRRR